MNAIASRVAAGRRSQWNGAVLSLLADFPLAFLAPALVLAGWVALWLAGRRVGVKFFLIGAAVAVLCIPAALVVAALQPPCSNPQHETWACGYSGTFLTGVLSALLTAGCVVGLLLLTAFLKVFGLGPAATERRDADR